jgi:hypothetical protein
MSSKWHRTLAAIAVAFVAACGGGDGSSGGGTTDNANAVPTPTGLTAVATSSSVIALNWTASAGNGVTYVVYRNGAEIARTASTRYTDAGLFADTRMRYQLAALGAGGQVSPLSIAVEATTLPFVVHDVAVGDASVNYFNVEFTADGRYMVWFEMARDGSGLGTMWHCGVDPDSGTLIPADGKGFRAFDSSAWGRANVGRDASGPYYIGLDRDGRLIHVRPTAADRGSVTTLTASPDPLRRAIYPTSLPTASSGYVLFIRNAAVAGGGYTPSGNDWFELRYISLADPATEHVIERQDRPLVGMAPMDIGFARWYRGKASATYGFFDANRRVQVREIDVTAAAPAPVAVTSDAYSKIDAYPLVFAGTDLLLPGIDGTATTHVYQRGGGAGAFTQVETILPSASLLANPALAQSNEGIVYDNAAYTTYQVNERGSGFYDTAFAQTGEIWLSTVLHTPQQQWRLSEASTTAKAEPEPYTGNQRMWVFYSATPQGSNFMTTLWSLRRADTPIGKR